MMLLNCIIRLDKEKYNHIVIIALNIIIIIF